MKLAFFSGGAAQAVATGLQPAFESEHGCVFDAAFGAVGTMRDRLLAGEPCDMLILSEALIRELERQGHVVTGSAQPLGSVATGVAIRQGDPAVDVSTGDALRATLLAARGLYVPNLTQSSAGIHVANVLRKLGIADDMADRVREYPNGATAMREMVSADVPGVLGCTQATEILYTPGVSYVGDLPAGYDLATVYTAAVATRAQQPELAAAFVRALTSPASRELRTRSGFRL
ncbi:molybdate ABC transporter substrate-binding protein [Bordetella genomosp. 13]|uniref:molybdate ABC transporter substrate-binding protein n=1 Tax=Bordetella genomosp. 13 TaxID=463040 RepID=UPI00119ECB27|nr:substrate-binding domain-containing protein [Bordetella genomosp. 13]